MKSSALNGSPSDHFMPLRRKITVPTLTVNKPVTVRIEASAGDAAFLFNLILDPGFGGQRVVTSEMLAPLDDVAVPTAHRARA